MNENLSDLAAELTRVDTAIGDAPLFADPSNPSAGYSDQLVELVAREEALVEQLIQTARETTAP